MLTTLTIEKKIGKQAKTQLTLSDVYKLLKAQGLTWNRTEIAFAPDGSRGTSIKSLKAIAKQNAFLQVHYRQKTPDLVGSKASGGWRKPWKVQDFAEAMADKNKKGVILPYIEWTVPEDAPDCEETLRAIDTVLSDYPQKNYQYKFHAQFIGLHFGDDTLIELPADYAKGPGPLKDGVYDVLYGAKWAHSHVRFGKNKYGASVLTHCLLGEGYNAPGKQNALPGAFVSLAGSLHEFKAKEVIRRPIQSVQESDNHYAKLTAEQSNELESGLFTYVIGLELALYRKVAGHDFAEPPPATEDNKKKYAYLMAVSAAVNQANNQTVRLYNLVKIRQTAAKAILEGRFTSFEALEPTPAENENLLAHRKRYEQLVEATAQNALRHLQVMMAEGQLPHRLERYYFPEWVQYAAGQNESGKVIFGSMPNPNPDKATYVSYLHIWAPEDQPVPPSLQALGYRRDALRPNFELFKQMFMGIYHDPVHAMGHFKKTEIDGVECYVVTTDREKFNRRKILGAVFRPLGYAFVKQPQGSVGSYELRKPLSEAESVSCQFDFGTWRQTVDCFFTYDGGENSTPGLNKFRMILTGWSHPTSIEISSEELFTKTIENIGAMAAIIEKEHIPGLRQALKAWRDN